MPGQDERGSGVAATQPGPAPQEPAASSDAGVDSSAGLRGAPGGVLWVLFAMGGVTVLRVRAWLSWHVFIGMLLVPPVLLKLGSTTWRFTRYYLGAPAYRRKGPPPPLLRLLG